MSKFDDNVKRIKSDYIKVKIDIEHCNWKLFLLQHEYHAYVIGTIPHNVHSLEFGKFIDIYGDILDTMAAELGSDRELDYDSEAFAQNYLDNLTDTGDNSIVSIPD